MSVPTIHIRFFSVSVTSLFKERHGFKIEIMSISCQSEVIVTCFSDSLCIKRLIIHHMVTACVCGSHTDLSPTLSEQARAKWSFNHDHVAALQLHSPVAEAGVTAHMKSSFKALRCDNERDDPAY